jgi:hypothetical protein
MLSAIVRTSPTIRSAVIIAASVALILPLPVRCLSCSLGEVDCTRCQVAHAAAGHAAHRSCCEHPASADRTTAQGAGCQTHVQSRTCGCNLQVPDRTYVAAERQIVPADIVAVLPSPQPFLATDPGHTDWVASSYGSLPPPVPHRILHCSWII